VRGLAVTVAVLALMAPVLQPFRTSTDAVRVDVLVTAENNRPVSNLSIEDFELRDNGVRQQIEGVKLEDVPLSLMIAVDVSGSVQGDRLTHLKNAVTAAVDALKTSDRVALLTFNQVLDLRTDWTTDLGSIARGLEGVAGGGATDLNDVAFAALTLRDDHATRSLVILFTDGQDTAGWLPAAAVLNAARRTDIVVYSVGLRNIEKAPLLRVDLNPGLSLGLAKEFEGQALVPALTKETGGRMLYADDDSNLHEKFVQVVNEFKSRYLLTYSPQNVAPGGWHTIEVTLKNRAGKVTARRGYQR
jgi:VWFA-related protein